MKGALHAVAGVGQPLLHLLRLEGGVRAEIIGTVLVRGHAQEVNYTRPKSRGFPVHRAVPVSDRAYQHSRGVLPLRGSPGAEEP